MTYLSSGARATPQGYAIDLRNIADELNGRRFAVEDQSVEIKELRHKLKKAEEWRASAKETIAILRRAANTEAAGLRKRNEELETATVQRFETRVSVLLQEVGRWREKAWENQRDADRYRRLKKLIAKGIDDSQPDLDEYCEWGE